VWADRIEGDHAVLSIVGTCALSVCPPKSNTHNPPFKQKQKQQPQAEENKEWIAKYGYKRWGTSYVDKRCVFCLGLLYVHTRIRACPCLLSAADMPVVTNPTQIDIDIPPHHHHSDLENEANAKPAAPAGKPAPKVK
jgi:hypothetical protein